MSLSKSGRLRLAMNGRLKGRFVLPVGLLFLAMLWRGLFGGVGCRELAEDELDEDELDSEELEDDELEGELGGEFGGKCGGGGRGPWLVLTRRAGERTRSGKDGCNP